MRRNVLEKDEKLNRQKVEKSGCLICIRRLNRLLIMNHLKVVKKGRCTANTDIDIDNESSESSEKGLSDIRERTKQAFDNESGESREKRLLTYRKRASATRVNK